MSDDRHDELRLLVQADCDGALTPRDAAVVAVHLAECAECRALQDELSAIKADTRADTPYHLAPEDFRRRMTAMIAEQSPSPAVAAAAIRPRPNWSWLGGGFALGAAAAAALLLTIYLPRNAENEAAVLDGHLRALQAGHLYEVASSDQHTVKPWFAGKLDFAPPVKDLAARGYPLKGGRLDTVGGRAVAALVYGRAKHVIDLYVWRASEDAASAPREVTRSGYNIISWSSGGMVFWAVSDLNRSELDAFVNDWRNAG